MAAIALALTLLALVAVFYGMKALAWQVKPMAITYFTVGGILLLAAIVVSVVGHALVI